ncbi:MAG: response regulator transcription factor [Nitrospiraceae bacterium]
MNILIVDDHAIVRRGLKETLADILSSDHPALLLQEAEHAQEAIDLVQKQRWDLVLLDLSLPDRSGLEVLREIKATHHNMPVLALSLQAEDHFALRALKAGASGFLSKDKGIKEVSAAVQKLLAGGHYISPELAEHLALEVSTDILLRRARHHRSTAHYRTGSWKSSNGSPEAAA